MEAPQSHLPAILRLPDEILCSIVSYACLQKPSRTRAYSRRIREYNDYTSVLNISLTCTRFRCISRYFFFESVWIKQFRGGGVAPSIKAIHANFRDNPSMRLHCRKLQLDIKFISKNDYSRIVDLLTWLTNVRYLDISGNCTVSPRTRLIDHRGDDDPSLTYNMLDFMRLVVQHMKRLEVLRCYDTWGYGLGPGCKGNDFIREIDIPTLKRLELLRLGKSTGHPPSNKQRTASFTSFKLYSYNETPEMRRQLISWPQALIEFEFIGSYDDKVFIDLPMIQSWLRIHKDTLKYVKINQLSPRGNGRLFDARDFPNLEQLYLSRWMMSSALDTAKADAELLLGPKLRKFAWDFDDTIEDGFREDWTDFGDKEEKWVRSLAQVAIERGHCLEEIWIEFTPENMGEEEEGYPWDRMDRLHQELLSSGLKVKYNEPLYSRDRWKEEVEWQRKWRMPKDTDGRQIPG